MSVRRKLWEEFCVTLGVISVEELVTNKVLVKRAELIELLLRGREGVLS